MVDNLMYVFGGCYGKYNCLGDLYSLDLSSLLESGKTDKLTWKKMELKETVI
jgi:hypothetical protein